MIKNFVLVLACLAASSGWAGPAQSISWSDLTVSLDASDNPYFGLTADEAHLLGILVETSEARALGKMLSRRELKGEELALAALESVGIDGAAKVQAVMQFDEKLESSTTSLNEALIGQDVEIPGFALPLSFDGLMVTEFLLVPYAGACIHTPPPPSNQIIHVIAPNGFEMRGLFDPVVVSGKISSSGESMSIDLSDGNAEFPVGYHMKTDSVAVYR